MADTFGIVANHPGDAVVAPGALCWLCRSWGGGEDSACVRVRSRGGRWVQRHPALWKLQDIRVKWLPPTRENRGERVFLNRAEAAAEAHHLDAAAQQERARRNMREIERRAGLLDENGKRNAGHG